GPLRVPSGRSPPPRPSGKPFAVPGMLNADQCSVSAGPRLVAFSMSWKITAYVWRPSGAEPGAPASVQLKVNSGDLLSPYKECFKGTSAPWGKDDDETESTGRAGPFAAPGPFPPPGPCARSSVPPTNVKTVVNANLGKNLIKISLCL